jgi:prepilin-type N-terminal cleavage/methylation domain-containing protein
MRRARGILRSRPPGRSGQGGFTLIELTVALVAGLIVALAIVGLSKEATATFHEEVRSSAAEATLRTAVDRLRADLRRASYMSTPNIASDPRVARNIGQGPVAGINTTTGAGIVRLAGIHLLDGDSQAKNNLPLSLLNPPLAPDAIEIAGNMTSAEQFDVQSVNTSFGVCARLTLSDASPAMYRINAAGPNAQAAELLNIFRPVAGHQFIVRLVDDTGRSQFLATCPGVPITVNNTANPPTAFLDVSTAISPVLTPQLTGNRGGVTPIPAGRAWVNPVQIVRWEITNATAAAEPVQYQNALGAQSLAAGTDATKYDLIRSYLDAAGAVVPETTEVIAEYAVDLNFAFSVDSALTPAQPNMITFSFDSPANQQWADNVFTTTPPSTNMPQRIRTVRARIATRTAQPDRTVNVPVTNYAVGTVTQGFMYRYCMVAPCATRNATPRWARARTLTTEVALPNQAGAFF